MSAYGEMGIGAHIERGSDDLRLRLLLRIADDVGGGVYRQAVSFGLPDADDGYKQRQAPSVSRTPKHVTHTYQIDIHGHLARGLVESHVVAVYALRRCNGL